MAISLAAGIIGGASAGLSVFQALSGNKAKRTTARNIRKAGQLDRLSIQLGRENQTRALGRQFGQELGATQAQIANRGVTGNTADLIEQALAFANLFDQRETDTNTIQSLRSQVAQENARLQQLQPENPALAGISGGLQGLSAGASLFPAS